MRYSPNVVEGSFCDFARNGVLGSSSQEWLPSIQVCGGCASMLVVIASSGRGHSSVFARRTQRPIATSSGPPPSRVPFAE
jgi:hypothetical protein